MYKGGNKSKNEPLNYRPISLICNPCITKGLSIILNERLKKIINKKELLVEEQNGFRKGRSCLDHVFVLTSVIQSRIRNKKSVFCCFVDFSKAFDFLDSKLLLKALKCMALGGKFLNFMECFYEVTFSAVKLNESVTDWFETKAGVRQGQNESPTLFALFINSLAQLIKDLNFGARYENLNVSI